MQQYVRMTKSSLIFATIISLTLAVPETRLRKCCPEGKVLSISPEMVCTIPEGDTDQLHIVDPEIADHQNEFPICKHQQDISDYNFYYTTLGTIKFLKVPCCIEIMQNPSTNEFSLVTVNSPHSENNNFKQSSSVEKSEESLQLLRINRCCPKDEAFNVLANYCVKNVDSSENYSNIHEFFSLLPKLPFHIVKLSHGYDACRSGALVTYEIAAEDIEYEDESLWVPCCIEIMQNRSTNKFSLVTVNSPHSENNNVEQSSSVEESEESLQLLRITRCCPKDEAFNVLANYCVKNVDSSENYSNIHEFFSLLPKLPFHIVKLSHGYGLCNPGALVTYEIAAEDIEYEDESLWVTKSEDGRHQKRRVTFSRGCLELTPNSTSSRKLVLRLCRNPAYCQSHSCVRKCCPERQFVSDTFDCNNGNSSSTQSAFYDALSNHTETAWSSTGHGVLFGSKCHRPYKLNSSEILGLTKEGYLRENFGLQHPHDSYCLDVFDNGSVLSLVCFPENNPDTNPIKYEITSSLEVISCVFLLLTLLVYIYLPFLQNLHGKTVMCNAASLLVSYTCLAIIPWVTPPLSRCCTAEECRSKSCAALGYTTLFSWLSAFSWLNIMCFDIWRTFGRVREIRYGRRSEGKRFLLYSMYAWGLALIITLLCVASDELPFLPDLVKPKFGVKKCWFTHNTLAEVIFFQLPVAIQLTSNIGFFILTSKHCNEMKAEVRRMVADPSNTGSSQFHADKDRLIMNVKLFIVMGITWIAEIASSLLNTYSTYQWKEIVFYWSDAINCLQGMLIFILFVLKPRVYCALKERLGFGEKKKGSSQSMSPIRDHSIVKKTPAIAETNIHSRSAS